MKQLDSDTTRILEIPSVVLMERAALAAADEIMGTDFPLSHVIVLAGRGNNGGDGVCAARILKERNVSSEVFVIGEPKPDSECAHQIRTARQYGIPVTVGNAAECISFLKAKPCTLLIDAIFGVGLDRKPEEDMVSLFRTVNEGDFAVVSIDIPSGVDASLGKVETEAIQSDLTVTFGYYKIGQYLYPGHLRCGKIAIHKIGILQDQAYDQEDLYALEESDLKKIRRNPDSHKGTFGKVLLIAGSKDIGGAAVLCTEAAFRSGAGMVRTFTHEKNRELLLERIPEVMVTTYGQDIDGLKEALAWADVVGIGPGISCDETAALILKTVFCASDLPVVLDADAITLMKQDPYIMEMAAKEDRTVIITPHIREFSNLSGLTVPVIKSDPVNACRQYAKEQRLICVLKDARTLISDGETTYINLSGNSGMATAGSGDVLLGLITSLLAQGLNPLSAGAYGCFIHGLSGDLAAKIHGEAGMVASDMIGHFKEYLS